MSNPLKSIILGDEHDEQLMKTLRHVLAELSVRVIERVAGVGGSQELEIERLSVRGEELLLEVETYVGVTIRGPDALVDEISSRVAKLRA